MSVKKYKCMVNGEPIKTARITVTDPYDREKCQSELNNVMENLKKQGFRKCQITTIFDTNNPRQEMRSAKFIDLTKFEKPKASIFINVFSQDQPRERPKSKPRRKKKPSNYSSDDEDDDDGPDGDDGDPDGPEYSYGVNADVSGYSIQYYK